MNTPTDVQLAAASIGNKTLLGDISMELFRIEE